MDLFSWHLMAKIISSFWQLYWPIYIDLNSSSRLCRIKNNPKSNLQIIFDPDMLYTHLTVSVCIANPTKVSAVVLVYGLWRVMCQQEAANLRNNPIYHCNLFVQYWVGGARWDSSASSSKSWGFFSFHVPCTWQNDVINSKIGSATTSLYKGRELERTGLKFSGGLVKQMDEM